MTSIFGHPGLSASALSSFFFQALCPIANFDYFRSFRLTAHCDKVRPNEHRDDFRAIRLAAHGDENWPIRLTAPCDLCWVN